MFSKNKSVLLIFSFITFLFCSAFSINTNGNIKIALLKYNGGGDWYANPTALPNLISFCNKELSTDLNIDYATVEPSSVEIFSYPFVHMTGHGNVVFSDEEARNMRMYLEAGGFLHIDDNYGMDPYVRAAMKSIFPEYELKELPYSHPVYHQKYDFNNGLPKIHEHDGKAAQGLGIIHQGRLCVFYSYETDLGDGWEDQEVHNDTPEMRQKALSMGANLIQFAFEQ